MISVDSSTLIAYFSGETAQDTDTLHAAIMAEKVMVCPIVITEVLSGTYNSEIESALAEIKRLHFSDGFWERAAGSHKKLYNKGLKAKLADAVIAQSSIDHAIPLLTRDHDFRHYATLCGLELV